MCANELSKLVKFNPFLTLYYIFLVAKIIAKIKKITYNNMYLPTDYAQIEKRVEFKKNVYLPKTKKIKENCMILSQFRSEM